jgi:hypothetical protein
MSKCRRICARTDPDLVFKKGYLEYVDDGPKDPSVGDMYVRQGDVSMSADGKAVGEYFTQATLVYLNKDINKRF